MQGRWVEAEYSLVVQTSWALIALLHAKYPEPAPIKRAVQVIMDRQKADGHWDDEDIVGVFNRNCSITYALYPFAFSVWALGKAHRYLVEKGAL